MEIKEVIKSGFWRSAGQNPFWIRCIGHRVFWLGMNKRSDEAEMGAQWCHMACGEIRGDRITLSWADLRVGKDRLHGGITVQIINEATLAVIEDSGDFGKSEWHWVSDVKNLQET